MEFSANKEDWIRYANAVRDYNPVHRDDKFAQEVGLAEIIAPGMYTVSLVLGGSNPRAIESARFPGNVFDGDVLNVVEKFNLAGVRRNYRIVRGEDVVCKFGGADLREGVVLGEARNLRKVAHTYNAQVSEEQVGLYLESIGCTEFNGLPNMFLASLSGPALLDLGEKLGLRGVHASQSFNLHRAYNVGPVDIQVWDDNERSLPKGLTLYSFGLRWVQGGELVASGKSSVVVFGDNAA